MPGRCCSFWACAAPTAIGAPPAVPSTPDIGDYELNAAQRYIHERVEKQRRETGKVRAVTRPGDRIFSGSAFTAGSLILAGGFVLLAVVTGIGWDEFDEEGRYLELRFGNLSVVSMYFPSGSSGDERQQFKFRCIERLTPVLDAVLASGRDFVICGDWNIVHTRRDIRNWTSNLKNSGCLPEERAWLHRARHDRRSRP